MTDSASGFSTPDSVLEANLLAGLADVEAGISRAIESDYSFVTEVSRHLVEAGGKRFRPLLVLLSSQLRSLGWRGVRSMHPDVVGVTP